MDWLEENIEESVREVVKLLRENGFNTECSCGHEMYVQCQYTLDGELMRLHKLLFNHGHRDYKIEVVIEIIDGHQYKSLTIFFKNERE